LTTFTDHRHNTRAWCHANLLELLRQAF